MHARGIPYQGIPAASKRLPFLWRTWRRGARPPTWPPLPVPARRGGRSLCSSSCSSSWARSTTTTTRKPNIFPLPEAAIHSAKPLPNVTLDKGRSVNSLSVNTSLPSALYRAIGKDFAECQSDTRQRKVAMTARATVTAALPSVKVKHSVKVATVPSATVKTLGKEATFAECLAHGTRQIRDVCRV